MDHLLRSASLPPGGGPGVRSNLVGVARRSKGLASPPRPEQTAPPLVDDGRYAAACAPRSLPDGNTPKKGSIAACTREPVQVEGGEAGSLWLAGRCYPR